ncbi:hypothetical protein FJZ53_00560 [Candidatus Woesearchaeota archaeon]|nr:hypothetical protein [Candidatus Woesearchaeota archaeon]
MEWINMFLERFKDIAIAPYNHSHMLWIVIPLVVTAVLSEIYFGRYKFEDMGWNSAYENSLVLFFVSMDLIRKLYVSNTLFPISMKSSLAIILIVISLGLIILNFFHVLPKSLAFSITSTLPINVLAYLIAILVYSNIPLDLLTFGAAMTLAVLIVLLVRFIWFLIPEKFEEDE